MKNFTSRLTQQVSNLLFYPLILLSLNLFAQENKSAEANPDNGYGNASYKGVNPGQFMKEWLLAGPFVVESASGNPDQSAQEKFFNDDIISHVDVIPDKPVPSIQSDDKEFLWVPYSSKDDIIDLDAAFNKVDFAAGYALAEIVAESPSNVMLAIGSDDGVKVWLNGKLIHKNWIARGTTPDDDIIPVTLVKGSNQLLIKVQDMQGGWGFSARFLDKEGLTERLVSASEKGDLDMVNLLLDAGAAIDGKNSSGLSPLTAARIKGREEVVALLQKRGAKKAEIPSPETLIDALYQPLTVKHAPGVAVLIAKDGKVLYKKGFGYADVENNVPVTPETKFRIGSITKQFTASAILKLQEEGKLKVTDKLSKYFPDFPRGDEVTLHHLLTHTSGIHSYTNKSDFIDRVTSPVTNEELLNYFKNDPYDFNPGEKYQYNNSGYFLLGYIIEKVSGKKYGQFLKEKFFDPIGMNNTGVHASTLTLTNEALGYTNENETYTKALNWDMSWAGGAGALYSTVDDLFKWNEAVFSGKVLSKESMKAAFTPVVLNNGEISPGVKYGYGWFLGDYRGEDIIQHSGGLHGFLSQLARYPKENLTVVMFTNISPAEVDMNPSMLAELYVWDKMDKQQSYSSAKVKTQDVKPYVGRYSFPNGGVMIITTEGNELYAQLTGQQRFPIFPAGADEFFWKVVEAKIKFFKNEKGDVTHGHFEQNGNAFDVPKLKDEAVVTVDPAVYKDYVGRYDFRNGAVMMITTEGNELFAQLTGQGKFPIFPSAQDEFFWKVVDAKIKFTRNDKGEVTHGHFKQGGMELDVQKLKEEKIITVDPVLYKAYAGKYDYGNNIFITVTEENGRLFAQGTNQPKYEIFPIAENEFTVNELNAHVKFVRENGVVNKIMVDLAGQTKEAPRVGDR